MVKKKVYISGCGGMLGEGFYQQFSAEYELKCTDIDVNDDWLLYLDARDLDAYREDVCSFNPDYLFHLGAYTDLEFCELNSDKTYITNTLSVENAVYIANQLNIPLLYISTAGIFDGEKDAYDDWDIPTPLGCYSRSKYAGELFVKENVRRHLICRAGWMMGSGPKKDKKFIQKIMRQIKIGVKELNVVNDKLGTPTYTHDFAKNVKLLIEKEYWGLYNMVCEGETSRLEVAKELLSILKLDNEIKINEVSSEYFKKEYFAERPQSERLVNKKLNLRDLNVMRNWKVALREYVNDYYSDYLSQYSLPLPILSLKIGENMRDNVFFSVMICCYNSEQYLRETLDSVVNQTYKNWEIVAINDGSTDKTEEILLEYKSKGVPITYCIQENYGFAAARNKAVELSKGEWIVLIDHDDICLPKRLEIQANHIRENPSVKLFFANTVHFDDNGNEIRRGFDRINPCELSLRKGKAMNSLLAFNNFIDTVSVIFNKNAALSIGVFDTSYKYVVDYDFFLRMGLTFDLFGSEELVSKWRVHKGQASQRMGTIIFKELNQVDYKYFRSNYVTNKTRVRMILHFVRRCLKRVLFS